MLARLLPAVALASFASAASAQSYVWIEAEDTTTSNFPERHEFEPADAAQAAVLSGGKWIGVGGPRGEALFAEYRVTLPEAGEWRLYSRKFWKHGPFRWRVGNGEWRQVTSEVALLDSSPMRQFVGANWVSLGELDLPAGQHTLRVELTENDGAAAFDAFLFTREPFVARGKMKPDEKYGRAPEGWFPFEPDADRFTQPAVDLRALNEPEAGSKGPIAVRGGSFVHSTTGEPVRFWAVNIGTDIVRMDNASVDALAKSLAKRGVNLVRIHGTTYDGRGDLAPDPALIDRVQYAVAAFKREGMYSCLSIYFPLWVRLDAQHGWAGYQDRIPFAMLYFDPKFQETWRQWWRATLSTPNPHAGGVPLAKDPAVAMAEIINEDSFFFWTFTPYENIPGEQMATLEKLFGAWAARKHGSVAAAIDAWGGEAVRGDAPAEGRAGVPAVWRLFNVRDERSKDATAFLAEQQKGFYEEATRYLKSDLGYAGTVYASNWTTASAQYLTPLEKYTYTAADFIDRHGYYGGTHEGPGSGYSLEEGHTFHDRTALRFENEKGGVDGRAYGLPLMDATYDGLPSMISEIDWPMPNRYRTEMPLLSAAYGAMSAQDAFVFFAVTGASWQNMLGKWPLQTPATLGQLPATALIFRKGLVAEASPVVEVTLDVNGLKALEGAPPIAPVNLDAIRAADVPEGRLAPTPTESIDPRAFYVGKVDFDFVDSGESATRVADLSRYIDESANAIRSTTGELTWDYGDGVVTVNAPQAQGATAFFKDAGPLALRDVTIESAMEYGAIVLVSLDDRPIATSGRMLLQVMSEQKNQGYEARETGDVSGQREIVEMGAMPIVVRDFAGTVTLENGNGVRVTPLDANLYAAGAATEATGGKIELKRDVMYYLIER